MGVGDGEGRYWIQIRPWGGDPEQSLFAEIAQAEISEVSSVLCVSCTVLPAEVLREQWV